MIARHRRGLSTADHPDAVRFGRCAKQWCRLARRIDLHQTAVIRGRREIHEYIDVAVLIDGFFTRPMCKGGCEKL